MNSCIFYGSKSEFEKKIPNNYRSLTDLVMELDVNKMLVQIEGQEHKDEKIQKVEALILKINDVNTVLYAVSIIKYKKKHYN